ncbi:MAG: NUDIX hydrolase [Candidatus Coatesbacteria bacterium]|nr:NUDIX hydrolase [Candidatus Coatesbacteria bacterium]
MKNEIACPKCGNPVSIYRNPIPTVDCIIELPFMGNPAPIVLISRLNPPFGWAIPGGFVDYGEKAEDASVREALEETGLKVELVGLLGVYSDPERDERHHTISSVYIGIANSIPQAGDDASLAAWFQEDSLPDEIAFDHKKILKDYYDLRYRTKDNPLYIGKE